MTNIALIVDTLQKKITFHVKYQGLLCHLLFGIIKGGFLPFGLADFESFKFMSVHIDR